MTKFKIVLMAGFVIASVVASLMIRHNAEVNFRGREAALQQQDEQLAALTAEHERLSKLAVHTNSLPAIDRTVELAKLQAKVAELKKQTNDLGRHLETRQQPQPQQPTIAPVSHPPEYWDQLHQLEGAKGADASHLASTFFLYASDHDGQFPSNFDQIASYLAKNNMTLSGTNQFEIVYQGSFDKLKGIPIGEVAVIRDLQAWQGPDGQTMRVYGMANGAGQIVGSDDNFQSWEAKHIISAPKTPQ